MKRILRGILVSGIFVWTISCYTVEKPQDILITDKCNVNAPDDGGRVLLFYQDFTSETREENLLIRAGSRNQEVTVGLFPTYMNLRSTPGRGQFSGVIVGDAHANLRGLFPNGIDPAMFRTIKGIDPLIGNQYRVTVRLKNNGGGTTIDALFFAQQLSGAFNSIAVIENEGEVYSQTGYDGSTVVANAVNISRGINIGEDTQSITMDITLARSEPVYFIFGVTGANGNLIDIKVDSLQISAL